ncbi:MAG: AI-2E family transporter [Thermoanaerobaculia bacterium]|nr:AI-2E family transporter [Thermoanaerobaculia bacterium]
MNLEFSPRQRAAVSAAVTILAGFVIVLALGVVFWLVGRFVHTFSNVLLPLVVAGVAALVFRPYYEWLLAQLEKFQLVLRFGLGPALALTAVFLSGILPLVAFGWFIGDLVVEQVVELSERFPAWWKDFSARMAERWPEVVTFFEQNPYGQKLQAAAEDNASTLVDGLQLVGVKVFSAGASVVQWIFGFLGWAVVPVYFAFFLMSDPGPKGRQNFGDFLPFLKPETREDVVYLVNEFVNIVVAFFRGQLIIAFLQALLFAVGFSIVGLKYGFIIGLALGFLNIIPYLGSIVGLGVALPLAFFQTGGGFPTLIAVLVVFTIVQMIEGYVLTPKIMGDRTGLHPMVIIVAIFFWGSALNGIMGMILAIPLTAFLVVFWRLAKEKYVQELV